MMVDYSDWLNSLPREFHLNTGWFLVIAIVSVSVMFSDTRSLQRPHR